MTKVELDKYFDEVIQPKLVKMAINDSLPLDMNELHSSYFDDETSQFIKGNIDPWEAEWGRYLEVVSDADRSEFEALMNADTDEELEKAFDEITLWQPVDNWSCDDLIEHITT